jgi:hypothetical protein
MLGVGGGAQIVTNYVVFCNGSVTAAVADNRCELWTIEFVAGNFHLWGHLKDKVYHQIHTLWNN